MPAQTRRARKKAPLSVGDRVEEIAPVSGKVRVGEIILVRDGRHHPKNLFRKTYLAHVRYGRIINFLHPDGLLPTSHENGYNGKDLLECVEITGKPGLFRKRDPDGNVKRFVTGPERCKICKVRAMDKKGGLRIERPGSIKKAK